MKDWLLANVEKLVLGLCALLMAYLVYSGLAVKKYDKKPDDFSKVTSRARDAVSKSEPNMEELKLASDLNKASKVIMSPVDATPYLTASPWRRPYDLGMLFRQQPDIFAPSKPVTQANSGVVIGWRVDEKGQFITREVPKSKASKNNPNTGGFLGGMGDGMLGGAGRPGGEGGEDFSGDEGNMMQMMMSGGNASAMGGGMGGGGTGAPTGGGPGASMMGGGGNPGGRGRGGPAGGGMPAGGGFMGGGPGRGGAGAGAGGSPDARPTGAPSARRNEAVLGSIAGRDADKKDPKKKKNEKEEMVKEHIIGLIGRHFVEIVASFPHEKQIKEYVRKLKEPANLVGLRYAMPEVERRELLPTGDWGPWKPIDMKKQFSIVTNSAGTQEEPYPDVMLPGLAMNMPLFDIWLRKFLTLEQFEQSELPKAVYTEEEMNPNARKTKEKKRSRPDYPASKLVQKKPQGKSDTEKPANSTAGKSEKKKGSVNLGANNLGNQENVHQPFNNRSEVKDAMVRYLDFTVEPGRRYQYRIRANVLNPNYNRADIAKFEYASYVLIPGEWSVPSEEVYVPQEYAWYGVRQPPSKENFDRAMIEVHRWDRAMGEWITVEHLHRLGDIIGVSNQLTKQNVDVLEFDDQTFQRAKKTVPVENRFDARSILIDVQGGKLGIGKGENAMNATFNLPKEIVCVNEFGDLIRRDCDADAQNPERLEIGKSYKQSLKQLNSTGTTGSQPGGGIMGGGGNPGGRGGGGPASGGGADPTGGTTPP